MVIKNYLSKINDGDDHALLLEVCEKLYEMKIDTDQVEGNAVPILGDRVEELESLVEKLKQALERLENIQIYMLEHRVKHLEQQVRTLAHEWNKLK